MSVWIPKGTVLLTRGGGGGAYLRSGTHERKYGIYMIYIHIYIYIYQYLSIYLYIYITIDRDGYRYR